MINLSENPVQSLYLKQDDHVLVDGHEFTVDNIGEEQLYLTAVDPEAVIGKEQWEGYEHYPYVHVRAGAVRGEVYHATMFRSELMARLQTGKYSLS